MISVIPNGYIKLIETWGSDERVIEAARMSTDKGFKGWGPGGDNAERVSRFTNTAGVMRGGNSHPDRCVCQRKETGPFADTPHKHYKEPPFSCARCECPAYEAEVPSVGDEKLLRYLYEHKHMTPFEMAGMIIEVQAPIFVFREWHRHRTQSYNELSARYTELPDSFYLPSLERMKNAKQSATNKQSSDEAATFTDMAAHYHLATINSAYSAIRQVYQRLLDEGVAREIARLVIPVAQVSRMRASANLRNWLQFLTLRMDPSAQWEIRQYANAVGQLIADAFPHTWELFDEERKTKT